MKKLIFIGMFSIFLFCCNNKEKKSVNAKEKSITETKKSVDSSNLALKNLNTKIIETKSFIANHKNSNDRIAFLIDMRIPSNKYRFFVVDLQNNVIIKKGLVAHGSGPKNTKNGEIIFSNEVGSNRTSLGIYLTGESYVGKFGKSYRLYGQEKSNSNAIKRAIILHKYYSIPDLEQTSPIDLSHGCPMVSSQFFNQLENIIDNSKKKIILSIYY